MRRNSFQGMSLNETKKEEVLAQHDEGDPNPNPNPDWRSGSQALR